MGTRRKQDNNLEILRDLITQKGNRYCFDCKQRGPTYVNTTIGSFVCSKCSGMLRGLTPPHRVKSISMATFSPEEMEFIKQKGNDYCKRTWTGIYEEQSDDRSGSRDEQTIKELMIEKYEKKWYYLEPVEGHSKTNVNAAKPLNMYNNNNGSVKEANINTSALISISTQSGIGSTSKPIKLQNAVSKKNFQESNNNTNTNCFQAASNSQFPVDFSNANIYNSNHVNNNMTVSPSYKIGNTNKSASVKNDKYAALADLDSAIRQNNLQRLDNSTFEGNPFNTTASTEPNVSKNPFCNGDWNSNSVQNNANPFSTVQSFTPLGPSKNPFL